MPLTTANLNQLKQATTPELRQLAAKQIEQAKKALEDGKASTNDVAWYAPLLNVGHYARWKPDTDAVEEAERVLRVGDAEKDEATKRARYMEAYRSAYAMSESVAKEAKLPPTNYTTLFKQEIAEPAKQAIDQALDELGKKVGEPLGSLGNAVALAGGAYLLYRVLK